MGRLTQAAREIRKRQAVANPRTVWIVHPDYSIPHAIRVKLRHGVNWLPDPGGAPFCIWKDATTGYCIQIIASPDASKAAYEAEAPRLMAEALAGVDRSIALSAQKQAARAEQERVEDTERRLEVGGPAAVSLDELREAMLYRRGPDRLAEIQAQAHARIQIPDAVNPEPGEPIAGDTLTEN